jgi:Protein of unknown function (DUF3144)
MADKFDDAFHDRVAAHIHMSNDQKKAPGLSANEVNHSMLFASARFCAWLSATNYASGEAMAAQKKEIADYFTKGFREMLEGNIDDYVKNFDRFMKT